MSQKFGLEEVLEEVLEEKTKEKLKEPPMYKVLLLNDDYTTMDFVVQVLVIIFHKSRDEATRIMLHVHNNGVGLCGIFPREIAETKVAEVTQLSEQHEFPLKCIMEEV
jgi:ATP-dependent Clp protease adaptor protein ClpS